jgi:hypothetical protein
MGVSVQKFAQLGGRAAFIWSRHEVSRRIRQRNSLTFVFSKSWKNCAGDPGNDETSVRGRKPEPYKESPTPPRLEEVRELKSKVKSTLIIFFDINGIVDKEFVLAGQTANSTYYCDTLHGLRENVGRLCSGLWRQKSWLLHRDNAQSHASFFTMESVTNFLPLSPPPQHLSVSPNGDKF